MSCSIRMKPRVEKLYRKIQHILFRKAQMAAGKVVERGFRTSWDKRKIKNIRRSFFVDWPFYNKFPHWVKKEYGRRGVSMHVPYMLSSVSGLWAAVCWNSTSWSLHRCSRDHEYRGFAVDWWTVLFASDSRTQRQMETHEDRRRPFLGTMVGWCKTELCIITNQCVHTTMHVHCDGFGLILSVFHDLEF